MLTENPYEHPPLKPDKGHQNGSCNRRACQKPGAVWFNQGTRAYYCEQCAHAINRLNPDTHVIGISGPLCILVTTEAAPV